MRLTVPFANEAQNPHVRRNLKAASNAQCVLTTKSLVINDGVRKELDVTRISSPQINPSEVTIPIFIAV
jgi:hypothetical protein